MIDISVTPVYAAIVAFMMAALSTAVGMLRGKCSVALGDGQIPELALAIRRFGNLSEYAAMAILLMLLMELRGIEPRWLHVYGATLVVLRLIHPLVLFDDMNAPILKKVGRGLSAGGTAMLFVAAGIALILA